jgi:hypothetical protein
MRTHLFMLAFIVATSALAALALAKPPAQGPRASSSPASLPSSQPVSASYLGKPVTEAWIKTNFATYGKNLFLKGNDVVNIVESNFDDAGRPFTKPIFVQHKARDLDALIALPAYYTVENTEGKICQFQDVKVQSKAADSCVVTSKQATFKLVTTERYLVGEAIKATTFYCTKRAQLGGDDGLQPAILAEMVAVKPATQADFIKYLEAGNRIVVSFKPITVEAAKKLPDSDLKLAQKSGKPQYYQIVSLPAPTK